MYKTIKKVRRNCNISTNNFGKYFKSKEDAQLRTEQNLEILTVIKKNIKVKKILQQNVKPQESIKTKRRSGGLKEEVYNFNTFGSKKISKCRFRRVESQFRDHQRKLLNKKYGCVKTKFLKNKKFNQAMSLLDKASRSIEGNFTSVCKKDL